MTTASDIEKLSAALSRKDPTIEVMGDLRKGVLKIKATGSLAWLIAAGILGLVAFAVYNNDIVADIAPQSLEVSKNAAIVGVGAAASGTVLSILGLAATSAAIGLLKQGGIDALSDLRSEYTIAAEYPDRLLLRRNG